MTKRIKKPSVDSETRRNWLKRVEEDGQTPPQIAKVDGFDVRTVRTNIQIAREEREAREARSLVLRNALDQHYADLVAFTERLDSALLKPSRIPLSERSDRLCTALREHLPRSPIWKALIRWEYLITEVRRLGEAAKIRLKEQLASIDSFDLIQEHGDIGLHPDGLSGMVVACLQSMARLPDRRFSDENFTIERVPEDLVRISYNMTWACATVPLNREQEVKDFVIDLMKQVGQWPECDSMGKVLAELTKVMETLREELATIKLRRVVPGRCRYCPL
jgi:hypothetical protein